MAKKIPMPFKPTIKSAGDTTNFISYPDSDNVAQSLKPDNDPFL